MAVNSSTATRRYDLDQLKTFLTGLVIVHHTAIPYGGAGNWQFRSQLIGKDFLSQPLILFNGFNQSFFMGLFFWISGRMSAQALSKPKASTAGFLGGRLVRLGIPTILNTIFGPPLVACLAQGRVGDIYQEYWRQLRGVKGVTWYTATLLTFDFVAASLQHLGQKNSDGIRGGLENVSPYIYSTINRHGWLLTAVISFVIRLRFPVGTPLAPLGVQPAYLAQYIMAYTLGYMSLPQGDLRMMGPFEMRHTEKSAERVPVGKENLGRVVKRSLRLAVTMSALTLPFCFLTSDGSFAWAGGWNLNAAAYAVWNEWSFMLVGPALMDYFQAYHNTPTMSWLWQPRYSYVAFIVHPPLSVAIEVLLDKVIADKAAMSLFLATSFGSLLGPAMLTGFVGLVNAAAAFAVGRCLLWAFPVIKRIL
ncbi:hypothetical protein J7T55_005036 [Diaporthe amygdali]|uniref:uncharacterized protein n=1 Tax=Phomopsis amygdali TaxID=1214568 RepID=UPI0022FE6C06|nr:uncharacterized protein J7T55_005036 [Diaporthe amygdali]KAJ0116090.1 hypothetical protein J7T55_005036 [Diaporthe amygdali]